jgi:hypothetical protein
MLIAYLADIYSNIYSVNFGMYINLSPSVGQQPVKYTEIFKNDSLKNIENLFLEAPIFIYKNNNDIITLNLKG